MAAERNQFVALIRAINVGGRSVVKMPELRQLFESLGFRDVATYIQTGNVAFKADSSSSKQLSGQLESSFEKTFGFKTMFFVLTPDQLKEAAANNPFEPERLDKEQHCHLMFLSDKPAEEKIKALLDLQGREYRFAVKDNVLYYAYSRKDAALRRRNIPFEKVLGVTGTARTWKVIDKLIKLTN
jgi:uncharacterized protein (DUF1697 family)